jgi:membrane protein involved in colicin uptake
MDKFTTAKAVTFNKGAVLGLTKAQAADRLHSLEDLGKSKYRVIEPVQFKAGETLYHKGDLPKAIAERVLGKKEQDKAESDRKAAAEAEVKAIAEAEAQAKAEQEARETADAEARKVWEGSDELKAKFPEFDEYLASLDADDDQSGDAGKGSEGGSEETK